MNLKELRKKNGLTQQDVADQLKINRVNYNRYELENGEPDIKTLCKLADFYHVTLDELVGREQKNIIDKGLLNDLELDIIDKMQTLDRDNQLRLQAYTYALYQNQQEEQKTIKKIRNNYGRNK